jgi:uncharacterized protein YnzC (UPF0291/DUF896 family)
MTIRRPNLPDYIRKLEIEMENHKIFLQANIDELNELNEKFKAGKLTEKDLKRAMELRGFAHKHVEWIETHKDEIANYYKPAMVIAE